MSKYSFQTEVNDLLQIIIHSLYSHKEIFLRELVSNASDAIYRLKFLTLSEDSFKDFEFSPRIDVFVDSKNKTLTVSDNGIGMNEKDLIENLGTIARSGTRSFIENLKKDNKSSSAIDLIGQFGVGFYSAFMVADKIEVLTRKVKEDKAWLWSSSGKGEFEITESQRETYGTSVKLFLNNENEEYCEHWTVKNILKKYSDHISFPLFLNYEDTTSKNKELKSEQINSASAFWKRQKSEIKDEDYKEFYKTAFHDTEDPLLWIHTQAEGKIEYTTLFYVPSKAPHDLFYPDYSSGVKLYVHRVFIMDNQKELLPVYLRFIRGIIDSEDLPLNVSREILQQNKIYSQIRSASVKKILSEILKFSENVEKYEKFWMEFGRVIKEGLLQDFENRDTILELLRFKSLNKNSLISLSEYVKDMKKDQKEIFYLTGRKDMDLVSSPLLEGYRAKGFDVLLMDDEIDEIVIPMIHKYKNYQFKDINRVDDLFSDYDKKEAEGLKPFLERVKEVLKDEIKDSILSGRLKDSPCCLTADKNDPTIHMQTLMKAMGIKENQEYKPVLEINPSHPLIKLASECNDKEKQETVIKLLYEEALLMEGGKIKDLSGFSSRINNLLLSFLK